MEITRETLYYVLSTVPQVLAATLAVLAAFLFFRFNRIHKQLIGDGKAVFDRKESPVYKSYLSQKDLDRLSDGIRRESIPEIKEILKILRDKEIEENISRAMRPTGFQYLFEDRFSATETLLKILQKSSIAVLCLKIITIIISIIYLINIDRIINWPCISTHLYVLILLFILSLVASTVLVIYSLLKKTLYEDLDKRDKTIEKNAQTF